MFSPHIDEVDKFATNRQESDSISRQWQELTERYKQLKAQSDKHQDQESFGSELDALSEDLIAFEKRVKQTYANKRSKMRTHKSKKQDFESLRMSSNTMAAYLKPYSLKVPTATHFDDEIPSGNYPEQGIYNLAVGINELQIKYEEFTDSKKTRVSRKPAHSAYNDEYQQIFYLQNGRHHGHWVRFSKQLSKPLEFKIHTYDFEMNAWSAVSVGETEAYFSPENRYTIGRENIMPFSIHPRQTINGCCDIIQSFHGTNGGDGPICQARDTEYGGAKRTSPMVIESTKVGNETIRLFQPKANSKELSEVFNLSYDSQNQILSLHRISKSKKKTPVHNQHKFLGEDNIYYLENGTAVFFTVDIDTEQVKDKNLTCHTVGKDKHTSHDAFSMLPSSIVMKERKRPQNTILTPFSTVSKIARQKKKKKEKKQKKKTNSTTPLADEQFDYTQQMVKTPAYDPSQYGLVITRIINKDNEEIVPPLPNDLQFESESDLQELIEPYTADNSKSPAFVISHNESTQDSDEEYNDDEDEVLTRHKQLNTVDEWEYSDREFSSDENSAEDTEEDEEDNEELEPFLENNDSSRQCQSKFIKGDKRNPFEEIVKQVLTEIAAFYEFLETNEFDEQIKATTLNISSRTFDIVYDHSRYLSSQYQEEINQYQASELLKWPVELNEVAERKKTWDEIIIILTEEIIARRNLIAQAIQNPRLHNLINEEEVDQQLNTIEDKLDGIRAQSSELEKRLKETAAAVEHVIVSYYDRFPEKMLPKNGAIITKGIKYDRQPAQINHISPAESVSEVDVKFTETPSHLVLPRATNPTAREKDFKRAARHLYIQLVTNANRHDSSEKFQLAGDPNLVREFLKMAIADNYPLNKFIFDPKILKGINKKSQVESQKTLEKYGLFHNHLSETSNAAQRLFAGAPDPTHWGTGQTLFNTGKAKLNNEQISETAAKIKQSTNSSSGFGYRMT